MLITNNLNTYEKDVILLSIYNFYHLIFILIIHDHTWFVLIFLNLYFIKIKKKICRNQILFVSLFGKWLNTILWFLFDINKWFNNMHFETLLLLL